MLDFFKELFSAMRATAVERVKSPILGAFAFSWIAFNWESILTLLFSKQIIEVKICAIKAISTLENTLYAPFLMSLAITIILPWLSSLMIFVQNKPILQSMEMYRKRNNNILEGRIYTERLRAKAEIAYEREKKELELEQQKLDEKIKESQDKILEKDNKIEELTNRIIELDKTLADEKYNRNSFEGQYNSVMQRGNDLINKYPYLLRGDEAGVIMVDHDAAKHLNELNSKIENNQL